MRLAMRDVADRALARPWAARVILATAIAMSAALALTIGGEMLVIAGTAFGATDQGELAARNTRVAALVNAQAIALTALAREPGEWSLRDVGKDVTVVAKGGASRDVVKPRHLRFTYYPPVSAETTLVRRGGAPAILVTRPSELCRRLFSKGGLSRFAPGPMEYGIAPVSSDGGDWKPYDETFSCDLLREGSGDALFLRASRAAGPGSDGGRAERAPGR